MSEDVLLARRRYLAQLLEALQRCVYYLDSSMVRLPWPISGDTLRVRKKDALLFETLAAVNERFAKLQDTLGAAMKHSALLLAEPNESFLKVLSVFERLGVIDNPEDWHRCRAVRNLAAHDYDTDYEAIASHFNDVYDLYPSLLRSATKLIDLCNERLHVFPTGTDFADEFVRVAQTLRD